MNIMDKKYVANCVDMCACAWKLGWHEYHAGNVTYRLTREEKIEVDARDAAKNEWVKLKNTVPALSGECFLTTASGSEFRILADAPEKYLGVIELNADGSAYRVIWGLKSGAPTSELPAHLTNHEIKKLVGGNDYRVVYHAHPTNLIALSFVLPLSDETFTRELWEMMPECAMIFPKGIGVIPWTTPASSDSAVQTGKKMEQYDIVLWAYHGAFCSGISFEAAFGLMHAVEKASEILVKVLSIGGKKQFPSKENLIDLKEPFGLDLRDRFLFDK